MKKTLYIAPSVKVIATEDLLDHGEGIPAGSGENHDVDAKESGGWDADENDMETEPSTGRSFSVWADED